MSPAARGRGSAGGTRAARGEALRTPPFLLAVLRSLGGFLLVDAIWFDHMEATSTEWIRTSKLASFKPYPACLGNNLVDLDSNPWTIESSPIHRRSIVDLSGHLSKVWSSMAPGCKTGLYYIQDQNKKIQKKKTLSSTKLIDNKMKCIVAKDLQLEI